MEKFLKNVSLFLLGVYRMVGTNHLGGACRFYPSCSEYAVMCFNRHNFLLAFKLVLRRLFKCRPGGGFGYDPVPERGELNGSK